MIFNFEDQLIKKKELVNLLYSINFIIKVYNFFLSFKLIFLERRFISFGKKIIGISFFLISVFMNEFYVRKNIRN